MTDEVLDSCNDAEYILVSDKTSEILMSSTEWSKVHAAASLIRKGGGEVTIFKATKQ